MNYMIGLSCFFSTLILLLIGFYKEEQRIEKVANELEEELQKDIPEVERRLWEVLYENEALVDYQERDGKVYTILGEPGLDFGRYFVVFSEELERIYWNDFQDIKPWKIEVANIDEDESLEVLIGVRKSTLYDQDVRNRLFVFELHETGLMKQWTGSMIAGDWLDFKVGQLISNEMEQVVFLTEKSDGQRLLQAYQWFDFGFVHLASSEPYEGLWSLESVLDNEVTGYMTDYKQAIWRAENGILVELIERGK